MKEKALQSGKWNTSDINSWNEQQIADLIFIPGISTSSSADILSGRGVGMDVVRSKIEKLRGRVEVQSDPGKGTTVILRLPLTLAIVDGMIVRAADERYIIPSGGSPNT